MTDADLYQAQTGLRALYGRTAAERIDELTEAADTTHAALQRLRVEPSADAADRLAIHLSAMARAAHTLSTVVLAERKG